MKSLFLITNNLNKIAEYQQYAKDFGVDLKFFPKSIEIPEIQSENPDEVLEEKINYVNNLIASPFIVEDTIFFTDKYPKFPGTNAKFVNSSLGLDGWRALFKEGDAITAVTTIGLSYLDKRHVFVGQLNGIISFKYEGSIDKYAPLNSIIYLPKEQAFLGQLIKNDKFENHRKKACAQMFNFLEECRGVEKLAEEEMSKKWDKRSSVWESEVTDKNSFVNYEDGYGRFVKVVEMFSSVINGNVLDIGCGTGLIARMISNLPNTNVTGIDISENMIAVASKNKKINLNFKNADVDSLDVDVKFDFVVSRGLLASFLPSTAVYDYFSRITELSNSGAYFIFDFLQNKINGNFGEVKHLTEFSLLSLQKILSELGWVLVYAEGDNQNRIRTVIFHKYEVGGVYFASGNPHKIQEFQHAVGKDSNKLYYYMINVDEIKSDSLEEIVTDKLKKSFAIIGKPVLCTDGGIFIESLNGFPGTNSKQAAQKLGAKHILKLLEGADSRRAVRRNCIGFYDGKNIKIHIAEVECEISLELRERYPAYDFDKILVPTAVMNKDKLTYSEMSIVDRSAYTELPQFINFVQEIIKKEV